MTYPVGTRVRLTEEVDLFPHGILPKGATGTVVTLNGTDGEILMDEHFAILDEWGNCLFVYDPEDGGNDWSLVETV